MSYFNFKIFYIKNIFLNTHLLHIYFYYRFVFHIKVIFFIFFLNK